MSENIETTNTGTETVAQADAKKARKDPERIPLRKKTDKSIRSASHSLKVLAESMGVSVELPEDEMGIFSTEGSPALASADASAEAEVAFNALVAALNGVVRVVKKVDPAFITEAAQGGGGGGTQLKAGDVVVAAKVASPAVKAMLKDGVRVDEIDEVLGLVKLDGIASALPRTFVARKDLAGRNAKPEQSKN